MHEQFIQHIIEHPDDDAPRLVYADWLEDRGDSDRAEFIRVECEFARLDHDSPRRIDLKARRLQLWQQYRIEWLGPLDGLVENSFSERGLINGISIALPTLLENAETIFRAAPIEKVSLSQAPGQIELWARCPYLARIKELVFRGDMMQTEGRPEFPPGIGDTGLAALVSSPFVQNLRRLSVGNQELSWAGMR